MIDEEKADYFYSFYSVTKSKPEFLRELKKEGYEEKEVGFYWDLMDKAWDEGSNHEKI